MMVQSNLMVEDAIIKFRNFSGKEGRFNPAGRRNFCVFLETEVAEGLEKDGWNIRWLEPKDEGETRQAYLQVAVKYETDPSKQRFNPKIVIITNHGKTVLNEETINVLDWAEIKCADVMIRPYNWDVNGKGGVKAYAKSLYVTIEEDELEKKYYDAPDSASDSVGGCGNCEECDGTCNHGH